MENKFDLSNYYKYFAQEQPEIELLGLIADHDISEMYQLDAAAVFKAKNRKYLVVFVSGCSCWPDIGSTTQIICHTKTEVDKQLRGDWKELLDKCQAREWKMTHEI